MLNFKKKHDMDAEEGQESVSKISLMSETVFGETVSFSQLDKMCGIVIRMRKNKSFTESKNVLIAMLEDILAEEEASKKKQKLKEKYHMIMTYDLEKGVDDMCNLSDIIWERAIEQGLEKGIEKGIERGLEQGVCTVILSCLHNNKTCEEIAEFTGINLEEVRRVANIER